MLTDVKEGIQLYWNKVDYRSSFNQIWILKYSKDCFDNLKSRSFFRKNATFLHITSHSEWKCINKFKNIIYSEFFFKMARKIQIESFRS